MSIPTRPAEPKDSGEMRALWALCFDDTEDFIELFFTKLYRPGIAAVAEVRGRLAAMAFAIPGFTLHLPGRPDRSVAYLYGVCTHPEHRGCGLGSAVSRTASDLSGCDITCLLPGSDSLRRWYARDLGAICFSRVYETEYPRSSAAGGGALMRVEPEEYLARREALLNHIAHIEPPLDFLSLAEAVLRNSGGGFFALEQGLCAIELKEGALLVREVLTEGSLGAAAEALLQAFPEAGLAVLRRPASAGQAGKDFAMALPGNSLSDLPSDLYWGLALD